MEKQRNSSLELLKLLGVVLIVFSHANPTPYGTIQELPSYLIQLELASKSVQVIIMVLFRYGGQLGNAIFIICSAWFLLDNNVVNMKKIVYMIADCAVISIIFLGFFCISGYRLPLKEIISAFLPITLNVNWFVGCYLLFYMIHPALNKVLNSLNQKNLLKINSILFLLYSFLNTLSGRIGGGYYYNDLIGFISIYFFVAYIKKYLLHFFEKTRVQVFTFFFSIAGLFALIMFTNYLGLNFIFFYDKLLHWNHFMNPLILLCANSLFHIFRKKERINKGINYISSLSILIYIIHNNKLIREYLKGDCFGIIYELFTYQYILLWVIVVALVLLLGSIIFSIIYKETLQKAVRKFCDKLYVIAVKVWNYFLKKILTVN